MAIELDAEDTSASIKFTALASWTATIKEAEVHNWVALSSKQGIGGLVTLNLILKKNTNKDDRYAVITIACGNSTKEINLSQAGSSLLIMDEADIKDFDKYYKPAEFSKWICYAAIPNGLGSVLHKVSTSLYSGKPALEIIRMQIPLMPLCV